MNVILQNTFGNIKSAFKTPFKTLGNIVVFSQMFFVVFLLLMGFSFTEQVIQKAESNISITLFLKPDIPKYKESIIKAELVKLQATEQIHSYQYFSEEETLEQFAKSQPDRLLFLQNNLSTDIPVSASFVFVPKAKNLDVLIEYFLQSDFSESIDIQKLKTHQESIVESKRTLEFLSFLKTGILGIIGIILIGMGIIISGFVMFLFHRKKNEVFIMRLVGASSGFIRTPFILESLLFSGVSLLAGWSMFFGIRYIALQEMMTIFSSRKEATEIALIINAFWYDFLITLPYSIGGIFLIIVLVSFGTGEYLLRKRDILNFSS